MDAYKTYQAFLSYAHHDAETNPHFFEALTADLEKRVTAMLVNERFTIWRDTRGLRTGDLWDPAIEDAIRASDVMIVVLTPRWISSDYCQKEYAIFQEIEAAAGDVQLVVPISVRLIEGKKGQLNLEQRAVYENLRRRQNIFLPVTDFLKLDAIERRGFFEVLANNIMHILVQRPHTLAAEIRDTLK